MQDLLSIRGVIKLSQRFRTCERCMEFKLWNMNYKVTQLVIGATSNWPVTAHYNDVGWATRTMRLRSAPRIINI